ncbi:Gp23-like protein [Clostridium pasteurianum DSM 525 = ATCC 6013]|uniref:Gp23-like protein n=1 Tax=Clostridium pasteurianum DSM 525 = ATCC 6013 TaxID=1262449 RepID=A0A0H3J864_CLOPA|nr:hypothetical protein [Clostridium pasteurianum]AJA50096.1 Gp23-like protein [Clostridium pasteurianum DSM 525 = ATCC 6013]AJA54084.1 Gp23-like protein [Clostridium pasteurianum DSM 525 = ATCC 6013]AOZ77212.1 hypothetical protein AQ983_19750 [Clostridium pasteurianum DSM 525 = ATCC 6013]AOZ81008.1 hypothetical protein AQ984_19745 [Clostridium pasteurianum]ELP59204.1 gp23-like protein [Clostridium pasteurianum DSM 525 = ATCC 6013]
MKYENLLKKCDNLNLNVKEKDLRARDGMCYGNRIAIRRGLKSDKHKYCVLLEELGHYYTTYGDITDQKDIRNRKQEKRARNWGYKNSAGIVQLISAFEKGIQGRYELAEYLEVTEDYLENAILYYKEKYGLYYEIDNYIVYFEPSLYIMKAFK